MPRYALSISYDGGGFDGWQTQPSGRGVQDALENALASIGERTKAVGAGRTDAGVHARAQIAHFDAVREWEPRRLVLALNAHLPEGAAVMRAARAADDLHARYSAITREYRYFIRNSSLCYPYERRYMMKLPGSGYDWGAARMAAKLLEGTHDFRAFCRTVDAPEDTQRTVYRARLIARNDLVVFRVVAASYLTNMIRIAVGNLIDVASGRRSVEHFASLIADARPRGESGRTVPPCGLFLWRITYPRGSFELSAQQKVGTDQSMISL